MALNRDTLDQALARQARRKFEKALEEFREGKEIDIFDRLVIDAEEEMVQESAVVGGCMIAVYPHIALPAEEYDIETLWTDDDGLPFHLTLAFIDALPVDEYRFEGLCRAVESVTRDWQDGLIGKISGAGVLGRGARALLVSMVGLGEMRTDLMRALRKENVEMNPMYDFCPHMTVTYSADIDPVLLAQHYNETPIRFDAIYVVNGSKIVAHPFPGTHEGPLVEVARRPMNRPNRGRSADFDPFLHPRNRIGKFRDVDNKIRDLQQGQSIDIFRFVKRMALPGVQAGKLTKTDIGYRIDLQHGKEVLNRVWDGPINKDDLANYLYEVEGDLDFTQLERDEKLEMGLPVGRRPGQSVSEDGVRNSRRGTPAVDAAVISQNGGLVPTGTDDPANIAGDPEGEHWVMATWDPDEYKQYELSPKDKEFLQKNVAAVAHRGEPGGEPTIEYFSNPDEAKASLLVKQNQEGAPQDVEQNVDSANVAPEMAPQAPASESPAGPLAPTPNDVPEPTTSDDATPTSPEDPLVQKDSGKLETTPPAMQDLMPKVTGTNGDPNSGEHPDNELYSAIRNFAVANTDAEAKLPSGDVVRMVRIDFENEDGFGQKFSAEDILNTKFENPGSLTKLQNSKAAIVWPNGLVTLYLTDQEASDMWQQITAAAPQEAQLQESAGALGVYNRRVTIQKAIYRAREANR